MKSVVIIVPVFNEAENLTALIGQLSHLRQSVAEIEIVIVDGGSTDNSQQILRNSNIEMISAPRGRAIQMNVGAFHSDADILVFLHADSELPANAIKAIKTAVGKGRYWGRFDVQIAGEQPLFKLIAFMMNWRSRLTGIATGDQAIFMRRTVFNVVGGFPEQPLMEDIEISKRLRKIGSPACLSAKVITSGRRWQKYGIWKTILLMWRLRFAYWRGVPASTLAEYYR